ncbi:MAG: RluA family pseudouridine synthase [Myxococcota bacterium]
MAAVHTLQVPVHCQGMRLDLFICKAMSQLSRACVQNLIDDNHVAIGTGKPRASYRLKGGEEIVVTIPSRPSTQLQPQDISLDILYEDRWMVVIAKPAGLVVHPGAGQPQGTLVNALLHRYPDLPLKHTGRPGLVHRLDKETSGVMVCARTYQVHQRLSELFRTRQVHKLYRVFCIGHPPAQFTCRTGHARHRVHRKRFTTKLPPPTLEGGSVRLAVSVFQRLQQGGGVSELSVQLCTGRTHQIRAHLADLGYPVLQDALYGGRKAILRLPSGPVQEAVSQLQRHALHAYELGFVHPVTQQQCLFRAELLPDLQAIHDSFALVPASEKEMSKL